MTDEKEYESEENEMSFLEHLDVLRIHLLRIIKVGLVMFAVTLYFVKPYVVDFLAGPKSPDFVTYEYLCLLSQKMDMDYFCDMSLLNDYNLHFTTVWGQFAAYFKIAIMTTLVFLFPYAFLEIWKFVKPALRTREKRNTRGVVFFVGLLFTVGSFIGFYIITPISMNFLVSFSLNEHPEEKNVVATPDTNVIQKVDSTYHLETLSQIDILKYTDSIHHENTLNQIEVLVQIDSVNDIKTNKQIASLRKVDSLYHLRTRNEISSLMKMDSLNFKKEKVVKVPVQESKKPDTFVNIPTFKSYFSYLLTSVLGTGIMFQLPIAILFLARMGLVTHQTMKKRRKIAMVIILLVSAFITPPDVASQILIGIPIYVLYEVSILIAWVVGRKRNKEIFDKE